MAPITSVTFDLWQTLLLDNRELGRARAQVRLDGAQTALKSWGKEFDIEHVREAYRLCYRQCHKIREENLDVSFREQVEMFINNIQPGLVGELDEETIQEIIRTYSDSFFVYPPVPHTDALVVLRDTKSMGLSIGLISNTGMTPGYTFRKYLDQQGMLEYFDILTFSDEVKLAKPSNEIFQLTLRSMGTSPGLTAHVGDHVQNDVVGAKLCGLKTIWITGFYENENPSNPNSQPDVTVSDLGMVVPALAKLADRATLA